MAANHCSSPKEAREAARLAGNRFFSIGKPCARGHDAPRYTSNGACIICFRENHKATEARPPDQRRPKAPKAASEEERQERKRQKLRESRARNPNKVKANRRKSYLAMQRQAIEYTLAYQAARPGLKAKYDRRYRERNLHKIKTHLSSPEVRARIRARYKERYRTDADFRMRCILRAAVVQALRLHGDGRKTSATMSLIGCSMAELTAHIEAQFQSGMGWHNWGRHSTPERRVWHIDHIRPCASFDLTDAEQQKACFHYTNLQPLWSAENGSKGAKLDWRPQMAA